jgi:drug/metabolite transporter (DMT)-like permease
VVVVLGLLAGACFGAVNVAVRVALRRSPDAVLGGFVTAVIAFALVFAITLATTTPEEAHLGDAWPFLVIGLVVPGFSQILWMGAIRDAGPSRAAVLMGTSPLLSGLLALVILSEPFSVALVVGTLLVVAGGIVLAWERVRPADFRGIGAVLALCVAVCLAFRDNIVRLVADDNEVPSIVAASALILGACILLFVHVLLVKRGRFPVRETMRAARAFLLAGVFMGLVYVALLAALDRGPVTVVAPLNGMNALWTVLFAVLVLRRTDAVGRRLVLAAVLVVAGGALVAATR